MKNLSAICPQCGSHSHYVKRRFFNYCKGCRYGKCKYAEYTELYNHVCQACNHCFQENESLVKNG